MAISYSIKIKTGDKPLAGTDAQVTIQLFGAEGVSEPLPLNKSFNHTNKFERGRIDQFEFRNIPQLGDLDKLILWHDNGAQTVSEPPTKRAQRLSAIAAHNEHHRSAQSEAPSVALVWAEVHSTDYMNRCSQSLACEHAALPPGLLSAWQLDYIEVTVSSNKDVKRFFFDAKKWIGGKVKREVVLHHHN